MINSIFQPYWFTKGSICDWDNKTMIGNAKAVFLFNCLADTLVSSFIETVGDTNHLTLHIDDAVLNDIYEKDKEFLKDNLEGCVSQKDLVLQQNRLKYTVKKEFQQSNFSFVKPTGIRPFTKEISDNPVLLKDVHLNFEAVQRLRDLALKMGVSDSLLVRLGNLVDYQRNMMRGKTQNVVAVSKTRSRYAGFKRNKNDQEENDSGFQSPAVWKSVSIDQASLTARDLSFVINITGSIKAIETEMIRRHPELMWLAAYISSTPVLLHREGTTRPDGSIKKYYYSTSHCNLNVVSILIEMERGDIIDLCLRCKSAFDFQGSTNVLNSYDKIIHAATFIDYNYDVIPVCLSKSYFDIALGAKSLIGLTKKTALNASKTELLTNPEEDTLSVLDIETKMPILTKQLYKKRKRIF